VNENVSEGITPTTGENSGERKNEVPLRGIKGPRRKGKETSLMEVDTEKRLGDTRGGW